MRKALRENALGLFFGLLFLGSLAGQAVAGWSDFNNQQRIAGLGLVSLGRYVVSADFAVDVAENWQSEYLQFLLYILATIWFLQKGAVDSAPVVSDEGLESEEQQKIGAYADSDSPAWARTGGWRTTLFSWSLTLMMLAIFLGSWFAQSFAGWAQFNEARLGQLQAPISWAAYVGNADFWSRTLQNWQSEFLAVGSMTVFSIYLRQRGSTQSKPVGASHETTGESG